MQRLIEIVQSTFRGQVLVVDGQRYTISIVDGIRCASACCPALNHLCAQGRTVIEALNNLADKIRHEMFNRRLMDAQPPVVNIGR